MIRSWSRYLTASAMAAVAVLIAGTKAFSHEERPAARINVRVESPGASNGAVTAFLKIDGVDGDSRDEARKGWIDVQSFSWSVTGVSGSTDRSGGQQDLQFTIRTGKASARLAEAVTKGARFTTATLSVVRAGTGTDKPVEYLTYKLGDVGVSTYQTGGSVSATDTMDSFSLSYRSLEIAYREQQPDGTLAAPVVVKLVRA